MFLSFDLIILNVFKLKMKMKKMKNVKSEH